MLLSYTFVIIGKFILWSFLFVYASERGKGAVLLVYTNQIMTIVILFCHEYAKRNWEIINYDFTHFIFGIRGIHMTNNGMSYFKLTIKRKIKFLVSRETISLAISRKCRDI